MDWISDRIAIGNHLEARDADLIRRHGLRSLLSLDGSVSESEAVALGLDDIIAIPLIDGPGNRPGQFRRAVNCLIALADPANGLMPVLVHCHAGRSRSAAVVAGWLMLTRGFSPDAAIAHVARIRDIAVEDALLQLLHRLPRGG